MSDEKTFHKLDEKRSRLSPGATVYCLCGLEAVAGAGWPDTHCSRDDGPAVTNTPERARERLREFASGERGPYDGIAWDISLVLTSLAAANAGRVEAEKERDVANTRREAAEWAMKNTDAMQRALAAEQKLQTVRDGVTGWLVERNDLGAPRWLCFGPRHRDTTYTTDAAKALRFARKEDAAAAMYHLENNDPALRVTEHAWLVALTQPTEPTP